MNPKFFILGVTLSLMVAIFQGCGEGFQMDESSSQSDVNQQFAQFNLQLYDKLNGSFRNLPETEPELLVGQPYRALIVGPDGAAFNGKVQWSLKTTPSDLCSLTQLQDAEFEAEIICKAVAAMTLEVTIQPSLQDPLTLEKKSISLTVVGEMELRSLGLTLYQNNCTSCHSGPTAKIDKTADAIAGALADPSIVSMYSLSPLKLLKPLEVRAIALATKSEPVLDHTKPLISIQNPMASAAVHDTIQVIVSASDDTALAAVNLDIDMGTPVGTTLVTAPFVFILDTKKLANGDHSLRALAKDKAGNTNVTSIVIHVENTTPAPIDTLSPTVAFINPSDGFSTNQNFEVTVFSSDTVGALSVSFYVDSVLISEDSAVPFAFLVPVTSYNDGTSHTLKAEALDAAGNRASVLLNFLVDHSAPVVTVETPLAGATLSGVVIVNIAATDSEGIAATDSEGIAATDSEGIAATDSEGIASTYIKVDGVLIAPADNSASFSFSLDTNLLTTGVHTLVAYAKDKAGNEGSHSISFNVGNVNSYTTPENELAGSYPATPTNLLAGQSLWEANCSMCHATEKRDRTYAILRAKVGPNSSVVEMRGLNMESEDLYKIYLYLNNVVSGVSSASEQSQVLVGTRSYVASFFRTIFVSNSGTLAADTTINAKITNLLLNQPGALGGTCQKNDETVTDPICRTKISETFNGDMLPNANALRRGYITRACEEILAIDQGVINALEKAGLAAASATDATNIAKAFGVFSIGRPLPASVSTKLQAVGASATLTAGVDRWRFILYAICRSAGVDTL
jgi:cytochrome c5